MGGKRHFVARVFHASENNVQPVKTAEEVEEELRLEYLAKLTIGDDMLPDPYKLQEGWLTEEQGITKWPMVTYGNIFNFLTFNPSELGSEDLNDYKTSKAYSYYASGWIGKIDYNQVGKDSKYCLLRATCRPSLNIQTTLVISNLQGTDRKVRHSECSR